MLIIESVCVYIKKYRSFKLVYFLRETQYNNESYRKYSVEGD